MNDQAAHHAHPDPHFDGSQGGENPHEIPAGVNVPNAAEIFKPWHLWLVYGLTTFTLALSGAVAYNVTTTKAVDRQLRSVVEENRSVLCDLSALRQATPPSTPRERATDRYFAARAEECTRATP